MKPQRALHVLTLSVILATLGLPGPVLAQGSGLELQVSASAACDLGNFEISVTGGSGAYNLAWTFGDGEVLQEASISSFPHLVGHSYPGSGMYEWSVMAIDSADPSLNGVASGSLALGPSVTLTSDVFPPILPLMDGEATLNFTAEVTGGWSPFSFSWDLDGDGSADEATGTGATASHTYSAAGSYSASVTVTDACGLTDSDTLSVEVSDPELECHPTAQKIAEALGPFFPDRTEKPYTCEDIFAIFEGGLTGSQLGFGRMWRATQLLDLVDDLTWEEILDWQLDGTGWGLLVQLDRLAEALGDVGTGELVAMVLDGTASINDIRSAARAAVRLDADFSDALARLAEGASPGELSQFYRLAGELDMSPEALDAFIASGLALSDIRHAANLAGRFGGDLELIAGAHASGNNWGEIAQAYRLADENISVEDLLAMGAHAYRDAQHEEDQTARETEREAQLIARMAEMYGISEDAVAAALNGCGGDWNCAREQLREQSRDQTSAEVSTERDTATAERLARQLGVSLEEVWAVYDGACQGDWGCTRLHFRNQQSGPSDPPGKK